MKAFDIFTPGKRTTSTGLTLDFSDDVVKQAVAAYDPAVSEAPIVVGHPKDNHPAFGWIKSLSFDDGSMIAEPHQVDADFAELVEKGRYKKRSASFYSPDSPHNPVPGTYYLRHVGFLGAMPPAVKGLRDVAFNDTEEGVVEFEEGNSSPYIWTMLANLFRSRREAIIADKGIEAADKEVPSYYIDELTNEAERKRQAQSQVDQVSSATPSFAEPNKSTHEGSTMLTPEQITALQAENDRLKAEAAKNVDFAERESGLAAREQKIADAEAKTARASVESRIDAAIKDGRLLPAEKNQKVDFAMSLADAETTIDFGEGDKAEKITQREAYMRDIESRAKQIDFKEHSKDDGKDGEFDVNKAQSNIMKQVSGAATA